MHVKTEIKACKDLQSINVHLGHTDIRPELIS